MSRQGMEGGNTHPVHGIIIMGNGHHTHKLKSTRARGDYSLYYFLNS